MYPCVEQHCDPVVQALVGQGLYLLYVSTFDYIKMVTRQTCVRLFGNSVAIAWAWCKPESSMSSFIVFWRISGSIYNHVPHDQSLLLLTSTKCLPQVQVRFRQIPANRCRRKFAALHHYQTCPVIRTLLSPWDAFSLCYNCFICKIACAFIFTLLELSVWSVYYEASVTTLLYRSFTIHYIFFTYVCVYCT